MLKANQTKKRFLALKEEDNVCNSQQKRVANLPEKSI